MNHQLKANWPFILSGVLVLVVLVVANAVQDDQAEKKQNQAFKENVRQGEAEYRQQCSACHAPYDPRFYTLEQWRPVLDGNGCPAVKVDLDSEARQRILDYLLERAAPTEEEAETIRRNERAHVLSENVFRGQEVFSGTCARCHEHPYFPKTRTALQWKDVLYDLASFHQTAKEPVWLDRKDTVAVLEYLKANGAGTPSDARAIGKLIEAGGSDIDIEPVSSSTIRWIRDFNEGLELARKKNLPVIADFTDLSGG